MTEEFLNINGIAALNASRITPSAAALFLSRNWFADALGGGLLAVVAGQQSIGHNDIGGNNGRQKIPLYFDLLLRLWTERAG